LFQHVLRIHRDLLGFDDADKNSIYKQGVVSRAIIGGKFSDRMAVELGRIETGVPGDDLPLRIERAQAGVNPFFPSQPFSLVPTSGHDAECAPEKWRRQFSATIAFAWGCHSVNNPVGDAPARMRRDRRPQLELSTEHRQISNRGGGARGRQQHNRLVQYVCHLAIGCLFFVEIGCLAWIRT
jgi:hypothetical protein